MVFSSCLDQLFSSYWDSSNHVQTLSNNHALLYMVYLKKKRSDVNVSQFPLTTNTARSAAVMPICNMAVNWSKQRSVRFLLQYSL